MPQIFLNFPTAYMHASCVAVLVLVKQALIAPEVTQNSTQIYLTLAQTDFYIEKNEIKILRWCGRGTMNSSDRKVSESGFFLNSRIIYSA